MGDFYYMSWNDIGTSGIISSPRSTYAPAPTVHTPVRPEDVDPEDPPMVLVPGDRDAISLMTLWDCDEDRWSRLGDGYWPEEMECRLATYVRAGDSGPFVRVWKRGEEWPKERPRVVRETECRSAVWYSPSECELVHIATDRQPEPPDWSDVDWAAVKEGKAVAPEVVRLPEKDSSGDYVHGGHRHAMVVESSAVGVNLFYFRRHYYVKWRNLARYRIDHTTRTGTLEAVAPGVRRANELTGGAPTGDDGGRVASRSSKGEPPPISTDYQPLAGIHLRGDWGDAGEPSEREERRAAILRQMVREAAAVADYVDERERELSERKATEVPRSDWAKHGIPADAWAARKVPNYWLESDNGGALVGRFAMSPANDAALASRSRSTHRIEWRYLGGSWRPAKGGR